MPMRTLFEDPQVDEIVTIDFTDYDYRTDLDSLYRTQILTLPFNSIDMYLLVSDVELGLPDKKIFSQAMLLNKLLASIGKDAVDIDGRTYSREPIHVLRPKNLESITISLKDSTAQKEYFRLGQKETEALFANLR